MTDEIKIKKGKNIKYITLEFHVLVLCCVKC